MSAKKARIRDAETTKLSILDAAERLFAERGFSGTTMRDLSEASGASQPLIHHHYGSKQGLYHEVKLRAVERFQETWLAHRNRAGNDLPFLAQGISLFFQFLRKNRTLLRLAAWSRLEGDTDLWPGEKEALQSLSDEIRDAQRKGILRGDMEPLFVIIMIAAVTSFWWENRLLLKPLLSGFDKISGIDETFLGQISEVFLSGMAAPKESLP
jgi:TetR/AcrR family transcriptional regulator